VQHVENIQYEYLLNKYIKCNNWRLAVRYDIYIYIYIYVIRWLKVKRQQNSSLVQSNATIYFILILTTCFGQLTIIRSSSK